MLKLKLTVLAAMLAFAAIAQEVSLAGSVRGENNEALEGATVQLQDQPIVAVSDALGNFLIPGLQAGAYTIIVRFLGFEEKIQEVQVPGGRIQIALTESRQIT